MTTAMPMTTSRPMLKPGRTVGRDGGEELLCRGYVVGAHAWSGEDSFSDFVLILRGILGAEIEGGGLALGSGERAHGFNGQKFASALAVGDDAGDAEVVIENVDGVADFFSCGGIVVEDGVVWPLKRSAGEKGERQKVVEALEVDSRRCCRGSC